MGVIDSIKELVEGSFSKGLVVNLASLLWTIDAKEHCIPTSKEINEALKRIGKYEILRASGDIGIAPSRDLSGELISENDIKQSMDIYLSTIGRKK